MELNAYLNFNGECAAAFRFYEGLLGGRIAMMQTHGDSPMKEQVPANWHDKVLHARLELDGQALMGSDAPPDGYSAPRGMYVSLNVPDATQGKRIFDALANGGRVEMPFEKTFWAAGFGMVVDRFGVPWMVNCDQPS
jgi:PhnB protein